MVLLSGPSPNDTDKTAFLEVKDYTSLQLRQLAWLVSVFERFMEDFLRGLQWEECLLSRDDIFVLGSSVDEGLNSVANLKLKPSKCILFQKSVQFIDHVSETWINTEPQNIDTV